MGSWTLYGLGTENQNLPGFITIKPTLGHGGQNNWSASFLPGEYQGTPIGSSDMKIEEIEKEPMPWLAPKGLTGDNQRYELDMIQKMNRRHAALNERDPDLEARIGALELAFRMQVEAPEAFDVAKESEATRNSTASIRKRRATSDGSACLPAACQNGACVLCSARTATNGISTLSFSNCTPKMRLRWTSRSRAC